MSARAGVAIAAPSSKAARTSPRRNARRFPEPCRERRCELVMAVPPRGDAGSWSTDGDGDGVRWLTRAGEFRTRCRRREDVAPRPYEGGRRDFLLRASGMR